MQQLRFVYGQNKGKNYTEEEDRFLLCALPSVGYGNWDEMKACIRRHWLFRFDWFFKSRTPTELGRRVEQLVRLVQEETSGPKRKAEKAAAAEGEEGAPPKPKKGKKAAEAAAAAAAAAAT